MTFSFSFRQTQTLAAGLCVCLLKLSRVESEPRAGRWRAVVQIEGLECLSLEITGRLRRKELALAI